MKTIRNAILALAIGANGCAYVMSSQPSTTSATGEAWYTEGVGFSSLIWASHVYYCPAPTAPGPVTCKEAKYVEAPPAK